MRVLLALMLAPLGSRRFNRRRIAAATPIRIFCHGEVMAEIKSTAIIFREARVQLR